MTTDQQSLDRLCELYGISPEYEDNWGKRHPTSAKNKRALLAAMGVSVDGETELRRAVEEAEARPWQRLLPPVLVVQHGADGHRLEISLPAAQRENRFDWTLSLEYGENHNGQLCPRDLEFLEEARIGEIIYVRYGFPLPLLPPSGYHRFELAPVGQPDQRARMTLIVAPGRCYQPPVLANGGRVWGPAIQLYAVRSQRNWGIGDFGDLKAVLEQASELGAATVGLNPLHALFPHNPAHASPYSPSSRLFLNVLYLDVEAIPDFAECQSAQEMVSDPQFQARLRALRASELVDYEAVSEIKLSVLERLYRSFREHHLNTDSSRGRDFRDYQTRLGENLQEQGLFDALLESFHREDSSIWGWPLWPEAYRDPHSEPVLSFAEAHRERVEFYQYLQWQAAQQLAAVGRRSMELGLGIGLYQDLAVSVNRGGAEAWANQDFYVVDASIGAPPDAFSTEGQDWGLPPLNPHCLQESAYRPFIAMLRENMRHAGALRIDHVMGLMRLYWVPSGATAVEGTYVSYPFAELLGILALESQRNQCMVIGEDLGTVPNAVREALAPLGVLSYRLFYFEKEPDGHFKAPEKYPAQALVAISTHDLPTLNGFWQGKDLELRNKRGLIPSQEAWEALVVERAQDRAWLRMALEQEGLLPADISVHSVSIPAMTTELTRAIHLYLAHSPAQVMAVQMEDVFGQLEQINLPGTTEEYPNWRCKLALNLEDWGSDSRLHTLAEALRRERGIPEKPPLVLAPEQRLVVQAQIPDATYRIQFNSEFTFTQAAEIIPYLHALGISHCYASPYLKARSGSSHGYDIIDHNTLNPEIGSDEDFEHFTGTLRQHGMGQILDVVPNHMGVMGSDNAWWLDVLENGQAAAHASYFDIDWQPFKEELRNKVLLPVLGGHYGIVLENGELRLDFDKDTGNFSVYYYEHRFPIDPQKYPRILGNRIDQLETRLGSENPLFLEYQSLLTAFGHLPGHTDRTPEKLAERNRDKEIHKRHLADLSQKSPDIAWFIEENLRLFNGTPGEPQSFDTLHGLLEEQAYRLAFWRVATDDINYRRFFDINDLAGIRMENEAVFRDTHRLILELVVSGKLDGLRIDHPDGLYNPKQYFQALQDCLMTAPRLDSAAEVGEKPLYVVVEKILESYERLPEDWPVYGTTGYEFANLVNAFLVNGNAEAKFSEIYANFIGEQIPFEELLHTCKRFIIRFALASELNVLANQLSRIAQTDRRTRDFTLNGLRDTLAEVVTCFPVYRTYITSEDISDDDKRYIDWAVRVARRRSQAADTSIYDFVRDVLLTLAAEGKTEAFRERVMTFAMKFQQYTGPLMAKGLEDTSFYRYNRLVSLNEVGGDPRRFSVSVTGFHHATQERARLWPHAMLSTSTHDSKRSEDVRARINVLSECPEEWERQLLRWSRLNRPKKRLMDNQPAPSANDEYLLYQNLLGAWPLENLDEEGFRVFQDRIENYMLKAVKEAKQHSSWTNPQQEYEEAVVAFVRALFEDPGKNRFLADFLPFQKRIARFGMFNSLSQTLLKLTSPGVPDIYQGNELWDFSLVDPDNRRPVNYGQREQLLRDLQDFAGAPPEELTSRVRSLLECLEDGRIKLYITWRALTLRRENSAAFRNGDYLPLTVEGSKTDHVCAFARRHGDQEFIVIAPRLFVSLLEGKEETLPLGESVWEDTCLVLPNGQEKQYKNIFTGKTVIPQTTFQGLHLLLGDVLKHFPLALLRVHNHET